MIFTKSNYFKATGVLAFVIIMAFIFDYQSKRNISLTESFDKQSVKAIVKNIRKGSGGFFSITTVDGETFSFCPRGGVFFESHVSPGDSILKPSYDDTIRIYNLNKNLKVAFLK